MVDDGVARTESGDGPLVVLVHGSMDRSTSFARMARHLGGYSVARYDRRGYGRSVALGPPVTVDQQVDDLIDVLGGREARIFGHSLGGVIALATAARAPDLVELVVAYESPLSWLPWWPAESAGNEALASSDEPAEVAEEFMIRMVGRDRWLRLPPSTRAARRAEGAALVAELVSLRHPNTAPFSADDLRCAVVAAHGSASSDRHVRAARGLTELVPHAELRVIAGAGHGVHLTHPAEAAALVVGD